MKYLAIKMNQVVKYDLEVKENKIMKRNNKALYEKIMRNVSKEVKRALNEDSMFERRYRQMIQINCAAKAIRKIFKREGIDSLYIDRKNSLIDDYLYLSRVFIDDETNKLTIYVSEDYYPAEPDVTDFVYIFSEFLDAGIDANMVYKAVRDQLGGDYSDIEEKYKPYLG